MTIHIDTSLLEGWDPRYSFIVKLSGMTGIEVADFYQGIETGDFLRKSPEEYTGRYPTKTDIKRYLSKRGITLENEALGQYHVLKRYAGKLGLTVSGMLREAKSSGELSDRRFTKVVTDPGSPDYYTTALDGYILPFLYITHSSDRALSYFYTAYGKSGWNPTMRMLSKISDRSGIDIPSLVKLCKCDEDAELKPGIANDPIEITFKDVREELLRLLGEHPAKLSEEMGIGKDKIYQDLRRNRSNSITIISLLPYLEYLGITLPEFFRAIEERKEKDEP